MQLTELGHRLSTKLVDGFWLWLARVGRLHPNAKPSMHGVEVMHDVRYAPGGSEHLLDVYRPRASNGTGAWPALLYVHGGGFRTLSKDSHWVMGLAFARIGYVVFNISYRLAPKHPFPAALEDVRDAYAWLIAHAADFGGDPSRIILAGESAGANLITALTVALCYRREESWARAAWDIGVVPKAVIPACGLLQVSDSARLTRGKRMLGWLRNHLEEVEASYLCGSQLTAEAKELASPLLVFERGTAPDRPLPSFFATVGTWDPLIEDTRRLKVALDRLGVTCKVRYYPGELHAFHALAWRQSSRQCWRDTYDFLEEHVAPSPLRRTLDSR